MVYDFEKEQRESETERIRRRKADKDWRNFKIGAALVTGALLILVLVWVVS